MCVRMSYMCDDICARTCTYIIVTYVHVQREEDEEEEDLFVFNVSSCTHKVQ